MMTPRVLLVSLSGGRRDSTNRESEDAANPVDESGTALRSYLRCSVGRNKCRYGRQEVDKK